MSQITIKISKELKSLIGEIDEPLYMEALKEIARKKMVLKRRKLNRIRNKIKRFEKQYSCTLNQYAAEMPDTLKAHDDWMEWSFLVESQKALEESIRKLEQLLGK